LKISSEYNTRIFISGLLKHKPQTTVLTVALVLVGMMFLIPVITDKALGLTDHYVIDYGKYKGDCCTSHLENGKGKIVAPPVLVVQGPDTHIYWRTTSSTGITGPEAGYVTASIKFENKTAAAKFGWSNPGSGENSCVVNIDAPLKGILKPSCFIEQGSNVAAYYCINGATTLSYTCSFGHNNTPPKSK